MILIKGIEPALRRCNCKRCHKPIDKGIPRVALDDGSFSCYKCFEVIIKNHEDYMHDYLCNALPKFIKDMENLKKERYKELIIQELQNG